MVKTLTRTGNSLALVLDKALLQLMNVDENTPVQLELKDGKLMVSAAPAEDRAKFEAAKAWANRKYAGALKRLAE